MPKSFLHVIVEWMMGIALETLPVYASTVRDESAAV
jgi:hypothetical protein